jgi:hypothetical protein
VIGVLHIMKKDKWDWDKKPLEQELSRIRTFLDDPFDPKCSPEGDLYSEVREALWPLLETLHVDAKKRKIIWPDGKRLDLDESVQNIHTYYPDFPHELIESRLISWLEMDYAPENYSSQQLEELDRLTERWIDDEYPQSGPR